ALAAYAPGAITLVAAIVALVAGWRSRAVLASLAVGAVGLLRAGVSQSVVAARPDRAGGVGAVGWPGAGSSLAALGLLGAVALVYGLLPAIKEAGVKARATVARAGAIVGAAVFLAAAALLAWPGAVKGLGTMASADVLPLAIPLEQTGPDRARTLVLTSAEDGQVSYAVLATDGTEHVTGR